MRVVEGFVVEQSGDGEPLVLLHGGGSLRQAWNPLLAALTARHTVHALDLPGFGESTAAVPVDDRGRAASIEAYADATQRLLAALDLVGDRRPHVAGNSVGAGIALELARRGAVRSATAFSPVGFWSPLGREVGPRVAAALRGVTRAGLATGVFTAVAAVPPLRAGAMAAFVGRPWRLSGPEFLMHAGALARTHAFGPTRRAQHGYTFPGHLPAAAAADRSAVADHGLADLPVTIAWGTRDYLLLHRTQSARARRMLPHVRHVDLPGCGHLPFTDDPQRCATAILETTARAQHTTQ